MLYPSLPTFFCLSFLRRVCTATKQKTIQTQPNPTKKKYILNHINTHTHTHTYTHEKQTNKQTKQ